MKKNSAIQIDDQNSKMNNAQSENNIYSAVTTLFMPYLKCCLATFEHVKGQN